MNGLMGFLQAEASLGSVGADFLRAAGELHTDRRLEHPYGKGKQGACFEVAFMLARRNPELTYCEGRALSHGIVPVEHAWCIDAEGRIVDTTWESHSTEYVGVRFDTKFLTRWIADRGHFGVLASQFPVELLDMEPSEFLASPSPEQLAATAEVLARARSLVGAKRSGRVQA